MLKSAASTDPSEALVYSTPEPGNYFWRVVSYASPDTANFHIAMSQCVAPLVGVEPGVAQRVVFAPTMPNPFTQATRLIAAMLDSAPDVLGLSPDDLVKYCESIAQASGGVLGFGAVASDEKDILKSLASALKK